jgi:hypothetical protein
MTTNLRTSVLSRDIWISSNEDLSQIDNVLVMEVIISETNSPKGIQMIKIQRGYHISSHHSQTSGREEYSET